MRSSVAEWPADRGWRKALPALPRLGQDLQVLNSNTFKSVVVSLASLIILIAPAVAAPEAFEVGPEQKGDLPRGKEADGIIGDFILRNDKVIAVISGNLPLRRANMSTFYGPDGITPGCLYDLTLRSENNDQITVFSPAGQRGPVSWVRIVKDGQDGEAAIETVVTAANNRGIYRRHEFRLRDGWQGLQIVTTLRNEGDSAQKVATDDRWTTFVRTGNARGVTWGDAVDPSDKAGYAYGIVEGGENIKTGAPVELKPGQTVTFTRFLAVGHSPAEAFGLVAAVVGPTGTVSGSVQDRNGAPATSALLTIRTAAGPAKTVCIGYPDARGNYSFQLPAGDYEIEASDLGRANVKQNVTIKAQETASVKIAMAVAAAVAFDIRDESGKSLPCKAQFRGIEGTASPNLGPENRAHGCVDQYHSEKGQFRVALPPGKYNIIVTRGIEYSHLASTVELKPEQTATFQGTLKRLVDTSGWVSADYHNHSTPSGDNTCGTDDRIINIAAENVEFAPTTEHNRLYDWRPNIEKLGLAEEIQTVPGMELTGSGPHLNSFPFKPEPFTQDNGAPVWNPDPRISAITLRDWQGAEPDRWVQINHPDMPHDFIDHNDDGQADGGFLGLALLIDGIETQNGRSSEILGGRPYRISKDADGTESVVYNREFIWLQMLNRGHRYAAMAVCDSHKVYGNGVGGWRMYLPSHSDKPSEIDWRENSRNAKAGRSILTTGPFLQVQTSDGVLPGGTTRGTGGVKLKVKVQCTDWIDIDRVQVLVNGRQRNDLNFTRQNHPEMFGSGVVKFDQTLDVKLTEDAHLIVVAFGENHDLSTGYGTSVQANWKPCAYNNPIFVDVDGGGFAPNGDMLGFDLPVKKLSVREVRRRLGEPELPDAGKAPGRTQRRNRAK